MGLSIAYQLHLPASTPRATVAELVARLKAKAEELPFAEVGPIITLEAGETLGDMPHPPTAFQYAFRVWASYGPDEDDPEQGGFGDIMPDAIGFTVMPGEHCEPVPIGVAWVPPRDGDWKVIRGQPWTWHYSAVCKTQYASIVSAEHFVRCHASIVALLDAAAEVGFEVTVRDEAGYWESRDVDQLLARLEHSNRLIAGLAGAIHDAVGKKGGVEAPIFEHPDFERLETKAHNPPQ